MGEHGQILLSDFGLALSSCTVDALQVQPRGWSQAYLAPEQLQGQPCAASDQYALAVMVWEWLAGRTPFGSSQAPASSPPRATSPAAPPVPPAAEHVLFTALAHEPAQRYPDVLAFSD